MFSPRPQSPNQIHFWQTQGLSAARVQKRPSIRLFNWSSACAGRTVARVSTAKSAMFLQSLRIMINDLFANICNLLKKTGVCNGILAYKGYYMPKIKTNQYRSLIGLCTPIRGKFRLRVAAKYRRKVTLSKYRLNFYFVSWICSQDHIYTPLQREHSEIGTEHFDI